MRALTGLLLALAVTFSPGAATALEIDTGGITVEQCQAPFGTIAAGMPRSVLCDTRNASLLDDPHHASGHTFLKLRAGSYQTGLHGSYLNLARAALGETRHAELLDLLRTGQFLRNETSEAFPNEWGLYRAALACVARGESGCDDPAAIVAGKLEEAIPELLATRIDAGPVTSALGLTSDLVGFDANTIPDGAQPLDNLGAHAVPAFFGPDRVIGTADDLPFIGGNGLRRVELDGSAYAGSSWYLIQDFDTGLPVFAAVVVIDGSLDERNGQPLVLYGEQSHTVTAFAGCQALGGVAQGFVFGQEGFESCLLPGGSELPLYGQRLRREGCEPTRLDLRGGLNQNNRCIRLNLSGTVVGSGVHVGLISALGDPAFRPAGAATFPADLTDLLLFGWLHRTPAARPPDPGPDLSFPPGSSGRRVDPQTGAPVRRSGPLECLYRAADDTGTSDPAQSVGPDGSAATTDDNGFPTVGNCLLWDDPDPAKPGYPQQLLRSPQQVALSHFADQRRVHELCTQTFDPDSGACSIDWPNERGHFNLSVLALVFPAIAGPFLHGVRTLRLEGDPFAPEILASGNAVFEVLGNVDAGLLDAERLFELTPGQGALLGCGPSMASACGTFDLNVVYGGFTPDGSVARALGIRGPFIDLPLGPDFANADLTVVTQEHTILKGGAPGALVGAAPAAQGDYFEAGVASGGLAPSDVLALDPAGAAIAAGDVPTDAWVEPAPWALDPEWAAQGVILYQAASQNELDPRCALVGPNGQRPRLPNGDFEFTQEETDYCLTRSALTGVFWTPRNPNGSNFRNDPTDPTNPLNVFIPDYDVAGEICQPFMAARTPQPLGENPVFMQPYGGTVSFDDGCTPLERFSANLERAEIAFELFGTDRHFDPFETVEELECWLDGDPANDATCDPIAGPDGIFTLNARVFNIGENDVQAVVNGSGRSVQTFQQAIGQFFNPGNPDHDEDFFFDRYDANSCAVPTCHLQLGNAHRRRDPLTGQFQATISALPLSTQARRADTGQLQRFSPLYLARKDRTALARLLAGETVTVDTRTQVGGVFQAPIAIRMDASQRSALLNLNINGDNEGIRDLDEDFDGVWDGADDFTRGPRALFNPACGSGIPGDILQDAVQHEWWSAAEEAEFEQWYADWFPPRSPVFCGSLNGYLGSTVVEPAARRVARWHLADANGDGIHDSQQCGDWNGNGLLDNGDLSGIFACLNGTLAPETCDEHLATGHAEANHNEKFDSADLARVFEALSGQREASSLTCANRPEGTPAL